MLSTPRCLTVRGCGLSYCRLITQNPKQALVRVENVILHPPPVLNTIPLDAELMVLQYCYPNFVYGLSKFSGDPSEYSPPFFVWSTTYSRSVRKDGLRPEVKYMLCLWLHYPLPHPT